MFAKRPLIFNFVLLVIAAIAALATAVIVPHVASTSSVNVNVTKIVDVDNPSKQTNETSKWPAPRELPIVPMLWTGPVFEGGPNVTLNGTVQSIRSQILSLNTDFKFLPVDPAMVRALVHATDDDPPKENLYKITCNELGSQPGRYDSIVDGIIYLAGLPGDCGLGANDQGGCGIVSCSYDTPIHFCNNLKTAMSKPCKDIGTQMSPVLLRCSTYHTVFGQEQGYKTWGLSLYDYDGTYAYASSLNSGFSDDPWQC